MAHEPEPINKPDIVDQAEALAREAEEVYLFGTLGFELAMLETKINLGLATQAEISSWTAQRRAFLKELARIKGPSNP
ncbi:MAG: hypothetical protein HY381_00525 [Candidatus Chisholmbacteria bacterium]|nr:hypothetical protein [Candidatus Chisholmbacteria bacterium]